MRDIEHWTTAFKVGDVMGGGVLRSWVIQSEVGQGIISVPKGKQSL